MDINAMMSDYCDEVPLDTGTFDEVDYLGRDGGGVALFPQAKDSLAEAEVDYDDSGSIYCQVEEEEGERKGVGEGKRVGGGGGV